MYTEVQNIVETYVKKQLSKGVTINQIVRELKSGSLPWELRNIKNVPISTIRRVGQHVSTMYIIEQAREQSAVTDLL